MYIMVDIGASAPSRRLPHPPQAAGPLTRLRPLPSVVNNVPINADPRELEVTSQLLTSEGYLFTDPEDYHPYCAVDYSNATSAEFCWLGDTYLALMDVDTELPHVVEVYNDWIANFTQTYAFDGLRIDAAKHVQEDFWVDFCAAAGVYCIGEVFAQDLPCVCRSPRLLLRPARERD